jgi:membrane carboxypeptidase/penicillin-binding protein
MAASGLVPEKGETIVITPPPEKIVHVRGTAAAKETRKREAVDDDVVIEIPDNIQAFADMTLRDLIEKFGTDTRFVDWLSATQKIEAINEKRLKNATTEGTLVSRTLVRTGIIEPIDACHIKLLTDGAKTIARRVTAMHSAKRPLDDIEKFVAEQITSFIRPVKAKVSKALKNV